MQHPSNTPHLSRRFAVPSVRSTVDTDQSNARGFTIVELLIVIVVIAILATLTIVAYNGIQQRATAASLTSDLDNASKLLKLYQVDNSGYPLTNDCSATP